MESSGRDRFFQGLKKTYRDSLRYLYDTGAPYEAILKAARKAEAEAEHYRETEPATAKGALGITAEVMEELAAVKAVASKAWGSQQDQKRKATRSLRREEVSRRIRRKAQVLVMDVVEQDISSENAPTPIRSL